MFMGVNTDNQAVYLDSNSFDGYEGMDDFDVYYNGGEIVAIVEHLRDPDTWEITCADIRYCDAPWSVQVKPYHFEEMYPFTPQDPNLILLGR